MADIPPVFNRNDFVSILLPGYVNVVSVVLVFRPGLLNFRDFSFDLFSTVLLIIAGPALGITLRQLYRTAWLCYDAIKDRLHRPTAARKTQPAPNEDESGMDEWSNEYARIRLISEPNEMRELEAAEADMDFSLTTALGLLLQALIATTQAIPITISSALFLGSFALLLGGYFEWRTSFGPIYNTIISRHTK